MMIESPAPLRAAAAVRADVDKVQADPSRSRQGNQTVMHGTRPLTGHALIMAWTTTKFGRLFWHEGASALPLQSPPG
jgi:hypothetical protein